VANELERIALALEKLVELAQTLIPPASIPNPPAKPFGIDHIRYLDDEELWQQEQEQKRLKEQGLPATELYEG
jgi:hypothetical protein